MLLSDYFHALLFLLLCYSVDAAANQHFLYLPSSDPSVMVQQGPLYTDGEDHLGGGLALDYIKGTTDDSSTWESFDVVAAADGVAIQSHESGYGNIVLIRHDEVDIQGRNYFTLYAHLATGTINPILPQRSRHDVNYAMWTRVKAGDFLGRAGDTGFVVCTAPSCIHLHYEVFRGGYYQNPIDPYDVSILSSKLDRTRYPPFTLPGCGADALWAECPPLPPSALQETALIGVVPDVFTTDGGSFEISVSPKDADGNLITSGVTASKFGFSNISVAFSSAPDTEVSGGSAETTGVETILPAEGEPATLVLTFDGSGSMLENDPDRLRVVAGKQFVGLLGDGDQAAVTDFGLGSTAGLRVSRLLQDFTSDKVLLNDAIDQLTARLSFIGTPLYDSLLDSLDLLDSVLAPNPAVVALTDGEENTSASTLPDVVTHANTLGIPLFTVGLGSGVGFAQLQDLARDTGGVFAEASDADALSVVFENIGFGLVEGRVVVTGQGTFVPPLQQAGEYIVSGELVTTIGGTSTDTPFSFPVDVEETGSVTGASTPSFYYRIPYTAEEERQRALEFMYKNGIVE